MAFKLRFDPFALNNVVDVEGEYFPEGILNLSEQEIFVDGGAWTGDSIRVFIDKVGGKFQRVYAFEPSKEPFNKLMKEFAHEPRVVPVNKGLYSHTTTLQFDDFDSTASRLSETGTTRVNVTSIDEIVGDDLVSFIKMNIEGAEAAALKGATKTVQNNKPKMAICVYHNPRDLWELPELIEQISPGYKFYLRLHDGGVIQLVVYAIPK